MSVKKGSLIFIVAIILLFSLASIALAAPPLQTPEDGSSVGDTIDQDNVKANLGTVMSGKNDDVDDPNDDDADGPDDDDGDVDDPDDDDADDPDDDVDDPDDDDGEMKEHPVASALAEYFGVDYEEVMSLHTAGNGFGNIVKAYFFKDKLGMEPADILDAAHGSGWGNMLKENGLHPGNGKSADKEKKVPPGQAKKNNDNVDELSGQSDGNNGNGNGNKGGNGKGKGKDKDK